MMFGDVLAVLLFVLLGIVIARHLLRARRWRTDLATERVRSAALVVVASIAIAASQPRPPAPPPRDPSDRKKPTTPPFGVPVAAAPDAGADVDAGSGAMLAAPEPDTRMAARPTLAIECGATTGFVDGCE